MEPTREHLLRNELNTIAAGLMVLRQVMEPDPEIADVLARMQQATQRCSAMLAPNDTAADDASA